MAAAAYKQVLDANKVDMEKLTHLRKSGIEAAAAAGLDADSIGTMSKHNTERGSSKMNTVYFTELFYPVLLYASGYDKSDINSYNNPRTRLQLPIINNDNNDTTNEILLAIFPQLEEWKEQQKSVQGDNRECARHFVNEVLPLLAKVVIQDGIYWIKEYPDSLPSRLLIDRMKTVFPGYATWARNARNEIKQRSISVGEVQVDTLNGTAQRAFNMMVSKVEIVQNKVEVVQQHQMQQQRQQEQQQLQILHLLQQLQHQQQEHQRQLQQQQQEHQQQYQQILQLLQQQRRNDNDCTDNDNNNSNSNSNNVDSEDNDADYNIIATLNDMNVTAPIAPIYPPPPPRHIYNLEPIVVATTTTNININDALQTTTNININDALQNMPTVPPIPTQLPRSLEDLVVQHYSNKLERYNNSCKSHWPSSIRQAFSKRKYLFNHIQERAARIRGPESIKKKMILTAMGMDQTERGKGKDNVSVDKFLNAVRNSDPTRKKRNRLPKPPPLQQQVLPPVPVLPPQQQHLLLLQQHQHQVLLLQQQQVQQHHGNFI